MKIIENKNSCSDSKEAKVLVLKDYVPRNLKRTCNICDKEFHPHSKFERFCEDCKTESELYHFAEWLTA